MWIIFWRTLIVKIFVVDSSRHLLHYRIKIGYFLHINKFLWNPFIIIIRESLYIKGFICSNNNCLPRCIDLIIGQFAILLTCIWSAYLCLPIMLDLVFYTPPPPTPSAVQYLANLSYVLRFFIRMQQYLHLI